MYKRKNCVVVAGSEMTKRALVKQVERNFEEYTTVVGVAFDEKRKTENLPKGDLYLISSEEVYEEIRESNVLEETDSIYILERTLGLHNIEELIGIPFGEKVLFVNDTKETAEVCINNLVDMGINHITYETFYPEKDMPYMEIESFNIGVTAGEENICPPSLKKIVNLGARVIEISSLFKIAELLQVENYDYKKIIRPYTEHIVKISKRMAVVEEKAEKLYNTLKNKLKEQGHIAMYTFDSILGVSEEIEEAKTRAKKLGKTDLTILIEGESGTGKELFASAIHNVSERKEGPFLAVNFSALSEELVESELFGYEEGAFTGAKKGGKTGLFEKAEKGTIFLDEIGDISLKTQTKLLRVLQEKEIMPVGSYNIKKVDIRIIAATNKDLKKMVEKGSFRADLYYRLKMGCIYLPPLRRRKADILTLANFFLWQEAGDKKITMTKSLEEEFLQYGWTGNVREVENTIKYMMAVRQEESEISEKDLPDEIFFNYETIISKENRRKKGLEYQDESEEILHESRWEDEYIRTEEAKEILKTIFNIREEGQIAGRLTIKERLEKGNVRLSEAQVRNRLKILESKGYLKAFKGKRGCLLTEKGEESLKEA